MDEDVTTEMSTETSIEQLSMEELIERSSFGTAEARAHRRGLPLPVARELVDHISWDRVDDDGGGRHHTDDAAVPTVAPYVYVSYPRDAGGLSREDADVRRFFRQLCLRLAQLVEDIPDDETDLSCRAVPGYLAGDRWVGGDRAGGRFDALPACRIFVPLISPAFLVDRLCRDEWGSFRRRDLLHRRYEPFALSAMVPVLWEPVAEGDLPAWMDGTPIVDEVLGSEYATRGLRGLIADGSPAYDSAVLSIAHRVREVAECLPRRPR